MKNNLSPEQYKELVQFNVIRKLFQLTNMTLYRLSQYEDTKDYEKLQETIVKELDTLP